MSRRRPSVGGPIKVDGFLCDSVTAPDGKLYVQGGGWNLLGVQAFPARVPRVGLALLFRVPYALANNVPRKFSLRLVDADDEEVPLGDAPPNLPSGLLDGKIRTLEGNFIVGRPAPMVEPGDEQIVPVAATLDGLVFEKPGIYKFRVLVDDGESKDLRFRVQQPIQQTLTVR